MTLFAPNVVIKVREFRCLMIGIGLIQELKVILGLRMLLNMKDLGVGVIIIFIVINAMLLLTVLNNYRNLLSIVIMQGRCRIID